MKKRHDAGFTLIEMMIAVAVIAVLALIALPSYRQYVERGHLALAHNELVNLHNLIKTERLRQPALYRSGKELTALFDRLPKDTEALKYYVFALSAPKDGGGYRVSALPLLQSGYQKAAWMDSAGSVFVCDNRHSASRYLEGNGCAAAD